MLVGLLCPSRNILFSALLAFLQALVLGSGLFVGQRLGEESLVEQRSCFKIYRSVEYNPVVLFIVRVHLRTGLNRDTNLILQDSSFRHAATDGMNSKPCRLSHLYQSQFLPHLQQLTDDAAALLAVAAVDVVEEERAHRLVAFQQTAFGHLAVVVHLNERELIPVLTSLAVHVPVPDVLRGVTSLLEAVGRCNGAATLLAAH